jgi:hypothetical protein
LDILCHTREGTRIDTGDPTAREVRDEDLKTVLFEDFHGGQSLSLRIAEIGITAEEIDDSLIPGGGRSLLQYISEGFSMKEGKFSTLIEADSHF